jgi:hypothetical protein
VFSIRSHGWVVSLMIGVFFFPKCFHDARGKALHVFAQQKKMVSSILTLFGTRCFKKIHTTLFSFQIQGTASTSAGPSQTATFLLKNKIPLMSRMQIQIHVFYKPPHHIRLVWLGEVDEGGGVARVTIYLPGPYQQGVRKKSPALRNSTEKVYERGMERSQTLFLVRIS